MHPRFQEFCETMPAALGLGGSARSTTAARAVGSVVSARPPGVTPRKLGGFIALYVLAALRRWRRGTLRYRVEQARIDAWLARILRHGARLRSRGGNRRVPAAGQGIRRYARARAARISIASCNSSIVKPPAPSSLRRCAGSARRRSPTRMAASSIRRCGSWPRYNRGG